MVRTATARSLRWLARLIEPHTLVATIHESRMRFLKHTYNDYHPEDEVWVYDSDSFPTLKPYR